MKRYHRLFISGLACSLIGGMAMGQDTTKKSDPTEGVSPPSTTAAPAKPPASTPEDKNTTAKPEMTAPEKIGEINKTAKATLDSLLAKSPDAHALFDKAYGYAVFDNFKLSFLLTGAGGKGVAVAKPSGERIYMNMGSAGIGIGAGAQKYQLVFLFENKDRFDRFVNSGWTASANANAVAGKSGANAQTSFQDGMAFYQITEAGLMLQADISGTKFWRDDELNKSHEATD